MPDTALLEFMYACPIGLVEIDRTGTIELMNPHAMKHLMPIAAETGRDVINLFDTLADCAPELRNLVEHFPRETGTVCENHRIVVDLRRQRDGRRKVLACTIVKLTESRAIVTFTDVTTQVEQERRLKQADAWFGSMLDGVKHYAVLTIASDGTIESVNEAFTHQTGHAVLEVTGRPLSDILDVDQAPWALCMTEQYNLAKSEGWSLNESPQRRRSGENYWCQRLTVARMGDDGKTVEGYTVVLRDVVRQASDTGDLRRLLTQDHLTGAANRSFFLQRFEHALLLRQQSGEPLSLVLIDIDHFKAINDQYGHPAGDQALRALTQLCIANLRQGCLFSRLGGEEFAVLMPSTPISEALSTAERLRSLVAAETITVSGHDIGMTASFGCASTAEPHAGTIDDLIKMADERLYEAKRSGRNRVCGPQSSAESPKERIFRPTAA